MGLDRYRSVWCTRDYSQVVESARRWPPTGDMTAADAAPAQPRPDREPAVEPKTADAVLADAAGKLGDTGA